VAGSSIDKEVEAGDCELCIRYPTLQAIYGGYYTLENYGLRALNFSSTACCTGTSSSLVPTRGSFPKSKIKRNTAQVGGHSVPVFKNILK
jgi:hypothetical protein